MRVEIWELESPLGKILAAQTDDALCALELSKGESQLRTWVNKWMPSAQVERVDGGQSPLATRLREYFEGELEALDRVPVRLWGTPFQVAVWNTLRQIPVRSTWSYAQLAKAIGNPRAVRAVGAANGQNPVAIVVPCHRVIASDGTLHGYGGGLWRKEWLLRHESALGDSCAA